MNILFFMFHVRFWWTIQPTVQRDRTGTAHKKTHAAFDVLTWRDWETWHVPTSMPKQIAVENGRSHSPRISQNGSKIQLNFAYSQSMRFWGGQPFDWNHWSWWSCLAMFPIHGLALENLSKNGRQSNVCKNFEAFRLKINVNTSIFQTPNLLPFAKVTSLVWNEVASRFKLIDAATWKFALTKQMERMDAISWYTPQN